MHNNIIFLIKGMIRNQTGRKSSKSAGTNLTFGNIETCIATAPNRKTAILSVWLLFQHEETCQVKSWNKWKAKFFDVYQTELPVWNSPEVCKRLAGRIKVKDTPELLEAMGYLKRADVFGKCTYYELAHWLKEVFGLSEPVEILVAMMQPDVLNNGKNDAER